jgi:hypothetical protein
MLFNQSIPGVHDSALFIGAPPTYLLYDVQSLKTMEAGFNLASGLLQSTGCPDTSPEYIAHMMNSTALEDAKPAWTNEVRTDCTAG